MPTERRQLVGRRYEDFLRNGILIELSPEEHLWRMVFADPRYNSLLDRRKASRRGEERPEEVRFTFFRPTAALNYLTRLLERPEN